MSPIRERSSPWACAIWLAGLLSVILAPAGADETVYRCRGADGVRFSDRPCGPEADTITIQDSRVGGSVGDNLPAFGRSPAETPDEDNAQAIPEPDPCRFISSTDLRTYLVREQVVPGMTREQVKQAVGPTAEVYTSPLETWVYQSRYDGTLYKLTYIYFRNGCVEQVEYREP